MEAHKPRRHLALDTNVLLDLAAGADFAFDFKETFQAKGYTLRLAPTVVAELHDQLVSGATERKRNLAAKGLVSVAQWDIQPVSLSATESAIAERFCSKLAGKRGSCQRPSPTTR